MRHFCSILVVMESQLEVRLITFSFVSLHHSFCYVTRFFFSSSCRSFRLSTSTLLPHLFLVLSFDPRDSFQRVVSELVSSRAVGVCQGAENAENPPPHPPSCLPSPPLPPCTSNSSAANCSFSFFFFYWDAGSPTTPTAPPSQSRLDAAALSVLFVCLCVCV